ncbi:D-glycero-beta-D-manno-heptose 1,7-bisphosphate 7-phosphatase [Aliiglaciecola lipolytica]|uniref:D,D-heptose 1,7-bisphosphate phosphatase n=1 Tax=Aliiglaciecola lipolytica E3 TaxID=1127673 RepID=K6XRA3_9ALTE|nr:D-glycero-beta-D-manno-heptose 1,7-bisphosphate 7-phosphatase [Aliiglaciecola lipolytica]GAC14221.1 D-glycero-D-manno-heptose 1,7-bisphosphate phosphatase [Aliiglaciecola lipolytica E3]
MTVKALFLDRDGVINVDHGYASKPEQIDFIDEIFTLCRRFQKQGYLILVVTNQSGIGRGYYTEEDFLQLSDWMTVTFKRQGIQLTEFFYCPHHPSEAIGEYLQECDCRKPAPGMLMQARKKYQVDMAASFMIGDNLSDMLAAASAGVAHRYLFSDSEKDDTTNIGFTQVNSLSDIIPL